MLQVLGIYGTAYQIKPFAVIVQICSVIKFHLYSVAVDHVYHASGLKLHGIKITYKFIQLLFVQFFESVTVLISVIISDGDYLAVGIESRKSFICLMR